jgi:peptidoglycan/LPS O-acetylase OafA/YrhL
MPFFAPKGSASVHLDALRGIAAFAVMMSHSRGWFLEGHSVTAGADRLLSTIGELLDLGHQWVIVFFVLSGYLVGGSVMRSIREHRWSWRSYLLVRLTRLYTVYLPALAIGGLLDWIGMRYYGHTEAGGLILHDTLTWRGLAGNIAFLQSVILPGASVKAVPSLGSNGPLWSLSNEFWYYLAFPFLAITISRVFSWRWRLVSVLVLLAWGWFVGIFIIVFSLPWLMGVVIPYLPAFPRFPSWIRVAVIGIGLGFFAVGMFVCGSHPEHKLLMDMLLGAVVVFLIWILLHCAAFPVPAWYAWLSNRAARSSYTLYLFHLPFLTFLAVVFRIPAAFDSMSLLFVNLAKFAAVLIYVQLAYELFEKNTDRLRNWLKPHVIGNSRRSIA